MMIINPCRQSIYVLACLLLLLSLLCASCMRVAAPLQEYRSSWKFAVVSDTQGNNKSKACINDAVVQAIADDIAREKPDLVIVAGDLVNGWFRNGGTDYDAQYKNWKGAMGSVYQAGIPVFPIRGNHDSGPERLALPPLPANLEPPADTLIQMKKVFRKIFAEPYIPQSGPVGEEGLTYSFVHKNAFFICLDQFTGEQHKVNQAWLDRQLAQNQTPHIFVYGHEPAFGTGHKDNLGFFSNDRDAFWNAIGRAGGKIYFCGHDHFYNRTLISDDTGRPIRQIILGTGGGVLRKWSGLYQDKKRVKCEYHNGDHHGYVLVTVAEMRVTITWKALMKPGTIDAWQYLDTFTYVIPAR
ncbi:MAG: metallophosphoesterase [Smithella sp.]